MKRTVVSIGLVWFGFILGFLICAIFASTKIAKLKSFHACAMNAMRKKIQKPLAVPARDIAAQEVGADAQDPEQDPAGALAKEEELFQELKERCR